jgi:hypothetical protein
MAAAKLFTSAGPRAFLQHFLLASNRSAEAIHTHANTLHDGATKKANARAAHEETTQVEASGKPKTKQKQPKENAKAPRTVYDSTAPALAVINCHLTAGRNGKRRLQQVCVSVCVYLRVRGCKTRSTARTLSPDHDTMGGDDSDDHDGDDGERQRRRRPRRRPSRFNANVINFLLCSPARLGSSFPPSRP